MEGSNRIKTQFEKDGFAITDAIFSNAEVEKMIEAIEAASFDQPAFRKAKDVFAFRRFLMEVPAVKALIFTGKFTDFIHHFFGTDYFISKSIYFDKPPASNWFVASHQDLTISVKEKVTVDGFGPWTTKPGQYAVQPPLAFLENNFTVRIHLDQTDEQNGALYVVPASHQKGIVRPETLTTKEEVICSVNKGGMMLMRPLLLHASGRTTNEKQRRVIHLEFSKSQLPKPLEWSEKMEF